MSPDSRSPDVQPEPLDERLRDEAVLDEIELTSRLMIAGAAAQTPLSQAEVDALLGLVDHAPVDLPHARGDRDSSASQADV